MKNKKAVGKREKGKAKSKVLLLPVPDNRLSLFLSFVKVTVFFARFSQHSIFPNSLPLPRACVLFSELHCGFFRAPSFHAKQSFLLVYLHFWPTMVEKGWAKRSRCLHLTFISPIVGFVAAPVRKRFSGDNNKNNRGLIFCNVLYFSLRSKHHEKACKTEHVLALK